MQAIWRTIERAILGWRIVAQIRPLGSQLWLENDGHHDISIGIPTSARLEIPAIVAHMLQV
jgi:hypothetical protein